MCEKKQILPWSFYDRGLISSSCLWGLLKASPKVDVLIPAADDTGRLSASQLKSPFQGYSESLSKHLLERHNAADTTTSLSKKTALFRSNSKSLILFETAPVATFLHRRPLLCSSNYHSCTGGHFPSEAATSPAPETFLLQRLPVLHQQLPVLHQQTPATTSPEPATASRHQQIPATTRSAPAITSPEPATTFLHQQTPATTSSAPATTRPEPATAFLRQQIPATTSSEPATTSLETATTFLQQQIPVLNQWPLSCTSWNQSCTSDHLSNEYQSCTSYPATRSCSNDHHPAAAIVCRTLSRFTIRHNKVWLFEATPLFCHSCLVRCQSLIFPKFAGTGIIIWPLQQHKLWLIT